MIPPLEVFQVDIVDIIPPVASAIGGLTALLGFFDKVTGAPEAEVRRDYQQIHLTIFYRRCVAIRDLLEKISPAAFERGDPPEFIAHYLQLFDQLNRLDMNLVTTYRGYKRQRLFFMLLAGTALLSLLASVIVASAGLMTDVGLVLLTTIPSLVLIISVTLLFDTRRRIGVIESIGDNPIITRAGPA